MATVNGTNYNDNDSWQWGEGGGHVASLDTWY
jgi:hypothetical protein